MAKQKQKSVPRKIPLDGYIKPSDPANQNPNDAFGNFTPQPPALPDPQIMPTPPVADGHVVTPVTVPPAPLVP